MVDITVGLIPPVPSNQHQNGRQQPTPPCRQGKNGRERRKNKADRRQGVRDGIIVLLSSQSDRRLKPDRRKK